MLSYPMNYNFKPKKTLANISNVYSIYDTPRIPKTFRTECSPTKSSIDSLKMRAKKKTFTRFKGFHIKSYISNSIHKFSWNKYHSFLICHKVFSSLNIF